MRQQINLYQPIFSEARKPLSGLHVAGMLVLIVTGLIAFSVYSSQQLKRLTAQVDELRSQKTERDTQLDTAMQEATARSNPAAIESHVKSLEQALADRTHALLLLKSGAAGQTTGFADRLEALARRHVEGLWIDHLVISGTNGSMSLAGATLNPDIVPEYLRSLAREAVLTGTRFDEFLIERPATVVTVSAEDTSGETKQPEKKHFIRFRAGNKALDQSASQGAAMGDT